MEGKGPWSLYPTRQTFPPPRCLSMATHATLKCLPLFNNDHTSSQTHHNREIKWANTWLKYLGGGPCCTKISTIRRWMAVMENIWDFLLCDTLSNHLVRTLLKQEWIIPHIALNIMKKFLPLVVWDIRRHDFTRKIVHKIDKPRQFNFYIQKVFI